jgi:hypothetical protein
VAPHFAVLCAASSTWRAQPNSTPDGRVTTTNREHRRIIPIIPAIEATSQARGTGTGLRSAEEQSSDLIPDRDICTAAGSAAMPDSASSAGHALLRPD